MSSESSSTASAWQFTIYDGAIGAPQVFMCLGDSSQAPWGAAVSSGLSWADGNAEAFIQAVVAAYHQYAPAGSAPQFQCDQTSATHNDTSFTVDPTTGVLS